MKHFLFPIALGAVVVGSLGFNVARAAQPNFTDANWMGMGGVPGADDEVVAAVADGSGNVYIGGRFEVVGSVLANRVAKWDGSRWSALGSGIGDSYFYSDLSALAVSGGNLYAAGSFATAGG